MANLLWRFLPSTNVAKQTIRVNGRTYTGTPGNAYDIPDFDGPGVRANGWHFIGLVGTTAQRPVLTPATSPEAPFIYIDTTVGAAIFRDGLTWRTYTGAAA